MRVQMSYRVISSSRSSSCISLAVMRSTIVGVRDEWPKVCLQLRFLAFTTSEESRPYQLLDKLV